ncbi:deoxyuridine 5'-triphosphate nucleotidohydrolase [Candidatus Micrarchaeota archaeon]|nr:deoxyuridine 5'-triphosphate nucleotidohydrolase [Candidatus Micrarchaeota archaeon]
MILPRQHLSDVIEKVISDSQYQPAGIDVTLKEARAFSSAGKIDFDNSSRKISDTVLLEYANDEVHLKPGSYKVVFNEYVKIPADVAAMCLPRSSLLRCGANLDCALWDPGYEGRSEALLVVYNEHGIILKRNAKIGQLVFIKLSEKASSLYEGKYKGENR